MKKAALAVIAAIVAVTFALPAFAEDAKPEKPKKREFTGEVTAVDAAAKTVTLKNKDGESKTFAAAAAKIATADKKVGELTDLKVGDKVKANYTEEGGKNVASKIAPPAPPKEKKKAS
ncbi:MAG: hypothetical protein WCS70_11070 [Verrucomicrobiota bacterium]